MVGPTQHEPTHGYPTMPFAYVIIGICSCGGMLATSQHCPSNQQPAIVCSECVATFKFGRRGRFERTGGRAK